MQSIPYKREPMPPTINGDLRALYDRPDEICRRNCLYCHLTVPDQLIEHHFYLKYVPDRYYRTFECKKRTNKPLETPELDKLISESMNECKLDE